MIKVGDTVRVVWNDNGTQQYVGTVAKVTEVGNTGNDKYPYSLEGICATFSEQEIKKISDNPVARMNYIEKAKLALKGEPEKSFIKAGLMTMDETLTNEGRELWTFWLVRKFGAEFKTEVVDPILKEQEEQK